MVLISPPGVAQIRTACGGWTRCYSDAAIIQVLDRARGDVDLAVTAMTMIPQPAWVIEILGPL